ncbi:MAG: hypothetical protein AAF242_19545, partial [Bacteroidota bacterium]
KMGVKTAFKMRVYHRYLGFFLAGIMFMYALTGIVLVFRRTDTFKVEKYYEKQLAEQLNIAQVGEALKMRDLELDRAEGDLLFFKNGQYDTETGLANYTKLELPYVIGKMTKIHKATTNDPLYYLNIFFGVALLFYVVSAFFMFLPKTKNFKQGVLLALGGAVLVLIMMFV